jgi:OOP family OmpA-OmpF porin
MTIISKNPKVLLLAALLAGTASAGMAAQPQDQQGSELTGSVTDTSAELVKGPVVEGIISARTDDKIKVTKADGSSAIIAVNDQTRIRASRFLGGDKLGADSLLNGLPVSVRTLQGGGDLLASQINLKNRDLKTAMMIHSGTDQRFGEQAAATEALRSRVADIGNYNVKSTTNVNFDTGKAALSAQAKNDLCAAASTAEGMNNAVLLIVGYTDSTGSQELNQELSEKRAAGVKNYLQQACGWKPYRMLTPTGMAEADPAADNTTNEGKAQNRRVAVNVLVSKGLDGM